MKYKRYCLAEKALHCPTGDHAYGVVACDRKKGHKKKHRAVWREGNGGDLYDVKVTWSR